MSKDIEKKVNEESMSNDIEKVETDTLKKVDKVAEAIAGTKTEEQKEILDLMKALS